jgi:4'-phosphopantetheinyl transferase
VPEPGEVRVWFARLDLPAPVVAGRERRLSSDERARAAAFRFDRDRRRFVAARGFLRGVLGECLGIPPREVTFAYGPHGKPRLADPSSGLHFNLSHSGERAACALRRDGEIGVDVEAVRDLDDADDIAARFFSAAEATALRRLTSSGERLAAFFNCWTRKEAYLKALGDGLARPLDGFDVTLLPGEPPRLSRVVDDDEEPARWSLAELDPGPGYVGAVAVRARGWRLATGWWEEAEP